MNSTADVVTEIHVRNPQGQAARPNGSSMLFTAAKVAHFNILPQGQPERETRIRRMVETMDAESFGGCTNSGECSAACPKSIPLESIANLNREFLRSHWLHTDMAPG